MKEPMRTFQGIAERVNSIPNPPEGAEEEWELIKILRTAILDYRSAATSAGGEIDRGEYVRRISIALGREALECLTPETGFESGVALILSYCYQKLLLIEMLANHEDKHRGSSRFSEFTNDEVILYKENEDSTIEVSHFGLLDLIAEMKIPLNRIKRCGRLECRRFYYVQRLGGPNEKKTCSSRCSKILEGLRSTERKTRDPKLLELRRQRKKLKRRLSDALKVYPKSNPRPTLLSREIYKLDLEIAEYRASVE